ncbi:gfo/Idh/MocA family oxidoreductase [Spongiactinospora gelatinilytica]|uniref:Gfo/Idh/MocA family oxidoreductase n=1 Tax=Spongiactinospora gelatinilytica TaxID=2666298 RepID=A0A2W2F5H7_9ACTN|nr:Gfo/Idh/MocA family oxidoreductase [Spongiactinospora gelatinilytica]PZG32356.1 gfo/Idh/MocA family oxidoreductase [Spongiactinospora gelatinilytica]
MGQDRLRVAVVGAGKWARDAHIPGWQRDPRVDVVALADVDATAVAEAGEEHGVERRVTDYRDLLGDPDIDVIDVATGNRAHFEISVAALEAGKHVLCEKPVHHDYRETRRAADLAAAKGLKSKLGFTFRYAPAVQYAKELIDSGFVGTPYIFNGYEQNSQWIDPATPLRQVDPDADPATLQVSSIEGYGAPIIDIMHWWLDSPMTSVVGTMRNFVPERMVRDTGLMSRMNIDDGDMWIAEFGSGALGSIQSSYVTVGNYPGVEARIFGSEGAVIVRLVDEAGICQTIKTATKDSVEFVEREIPQRFFPENGHSREPWPFLFYSNLCRNFATEILSGQEANQGDFRQGALVQETVNAFERSYRDRRWVGFPLEV